MFEVPGWESGANAIKVNFSKIKKNKNKETTKIKNKIVEGIVKAKHKVENGQKSFHNNHKGGKYKNNNKSHNYDSTFAQTKPKSRKENNNMKAQERINLRNQKNNTPQQEFTKFKKRHEKKQETDNSNKIIPQGKKTKLENKHKSKQIIKTIELDNSNTLNEEKPAPTNTTENKVEFNENKMLLKKKIIKNNENKKKHLQKMLEMGRTPNMVNTNTSSNKLRTRMLERLKAAQFRYLNEKLYTSDGSVAQQMFQSDPESFHTYHAGYQQQLQKWPVNPLDVIANKILQMPTSMKIADMGCGEGALSKRLPHCVRSFDLISTHANVESCDMAHTPLLAQSMDLVVYCLALMGTTLTQYMLEANRVLKNGGIVMIAEVESRFDDVQKFTKDVERLGFKLTNLDNSHKVFYFIEFKKVTNAPSKKCKLPCITLKPCLYKRR